MREELWKNIPGYEGLYTVSNYGNIRRINADCKIKYRKLKKFKQHGYEIICLSKNNIRKNYRVHRLVMMAFKGRSSLTVNHMNGIKTDNRLCNLEYLSIYQNSMHAIKIGLVDNSGENCSTAKLKERDVLNIRKLFKLNKTNKEISKNYGVSASCISDIRRGITWKFLLKRQDLRRYEAKTKND